MKRLLSFMLCASVFFVFGCNPTPEPTPEPTPDPVLSVSPESLAFTAEGGAQTVQVKANNPWTASASGSGISVNPSSGDGDATVTITATATNSIDPITGTVSFRTGRLYATVSVTQEERKVIRVGDVMTIPAEGGSFAVDVQYNTDVVVEVESAAQSWITFVEVRALTSRKLEFLFSDNYFNTEQRTGKVTVKDKNGKVSPITLTFVQAENQAVQEEIKIKNALMRIYDAMDGPNWTITMKWDMSQPLRDWQGVGWNERTYRLSLHFQGDFGLKGEFPDCFDDLPGLWDFFVQNEPGITGTLPPSFGRLKNLTHLIINNTSMTSLPDIFGELPLTHVNLFGNSLMTGPLPETLGGSPELAYLAIENNAFTGKVPDSWARLGTKLEICESSLDVNVPDSFVTSPDADWLINMYLFAAESRTTSLVAGDYDIPAYWPRRDIKDLVTGKTIDYKGIVSRNKATVLLNWATWCPYSKVLMPILKRMYDKYHGDGLEIIAAFNADSPTEDSGKPLKDVLLERNYDTWYNFCLWDFSGTEWNMWCAGTPSAIIVDSKGNVMKTGRGNDIDHSRNRFGYTAPQNLMPILEEIFGPLEENEDYTSTDYSKDGEVMTLQKASVGKGINIVFLGDAYVDRDMDADGLYESMMRQSMEEFFAIEPYKTFRNRFNVYAVKVVSKNEKTGPGYSTALGSIATYTSISTGNEDKIFEYALKVPEIKDKKNLLIGVLVNSVSERGITSMSESLQSGIAYYGSTRNASEAFGITLRHEAGGHGFAFLDDEYGDYQGAIPQTHIDFRNSMYKQYGWYSNVDFTNDPSKVKWSVFLNDDRYKSEVGIFEGGSLYSKGAYRPSQNSMMRDNYEYFNAPSRWAIYKRIMELSGETASFDKFLEYDAVNRASASAAPRPPLKAAAAPKRSIVHSAPPVVIP